MELKNISNKPSVDLEQIKQLMYQGRFKEALNSSLNLEKNPNLESLEQLSNLNLRGRIYCYTEKFNQAIKVGEIAYKLSKNLDCVYEPIDALLLKTSVFYFGKLEQASAFIVEAENLFKTLNNIPNDEYNRINTEILLIKSKIFQHKGNINEALELAIQCFELRNKNSQKLDLSLIYYQLGIIYLYKSEPDIALDYAMKSLALQEELNNKNGLARSLYLLGLSYYTKGNFDEALKIVKQSLLTNEISSLNKLESISLLAGIYKNKGELDRSIRYGNRAIKLAEKDSYVLEIISTTMGNGATYRMKGAFDQAKICLNRSLELSKEIGSPYGIQSSLFYIILTNLDIDLLNQAQDYLVQLENLANQSESKPFSNIYLIAKALVLKKSGRIRYRTEAEMLLKSIVADDISFAPQLYLLSLVNLCDLFLEELKFTNNLEVLDELNPMINKILEIAERQNAYSWLTETKLLQAKLALIQMDFDKTKQLLTQAQRIAEIHGLTLLASKISDEHDNLLDHLNDWVNLQRMNAPMSERIKLASFDGVVDRMQGKRAIEIPRLVHEEPVLLLIIGMGGFPLFSTQFGERVKLEEDLISGFLTAFNSFSSELFSKGLDRAKFGEHTLLMQAAGSFSVCYLFKGKTYLAKRKLTKFTERIKKTTDIWNTLNKHYEANQTIDLKNTPSLELLIREIFISKNP